MFAFSHCALIPSPILPTRKCQLAKGGLQIMPRRGSSTFNSQLEGPFSISPPDAAESAPRREPTILRISRRARGPKGGEVKKRSCALESLWPGYCASASSPLRRLIVIQSRLPPSQKVPRVADGAVRYPRGVTGQIQSRAPRPASPPDEAGIFRTKRAQPNLRVSRTVVSRYLTRGRC